jgi:hypothetical protein
LGAFLVAAVGLNLAATRHGSGLTSDSLIYLNASRNLLAGRGVSRLSGLTGTKPITHYPPLFPAALAGLQAAGLTTADAARVLGAAALGLNVALVGLSIWRMTHNEWASMLGSFLVLSSPIMIDLHSWAMSEPMFLLWCLCAALLLDAFTSTGRMRFLILTAFAAALGALTRYVGLALIAGLALALLLRSSGRAGRRVLETGAFAAIAVVPISGWYIRNLILSGSLSNYSLVWHAPDSTVLKRPFAVAWEWISPTLFTYPALIGLIVLVVAGGLWLLLKGWKRWGRPPGRWTRSLRKADLRGGLLCFIAAYVGAIGFSILFLGATVPVDQRISSPVYLSLIILLVDAAVSWWTRQERVALKAWLIAAAGVLALSYLARSAALVDALWDESRGYASPSLAVAGSSEVIGRVPDDVLVYTNSFAPLEYFYGRGSVSIPLPGDPVTRQVVGSYAQDLQRMRERIGRGDAVMVLFFATPGEGKVPIELAQGLTLLCERDGLSLYVGDEYTGPRECGP